MGCGAGKKDPSTKGVKTITSSNFILQINEDITNHYQLGKKLGAGSFGEVRACTHKKTKMKRAVKIFKKKALQGDSEVKSMIATEFTVLKKLDHPNIMKLYESFSDANHIYIVIELLEGGELYQKILESKAVGEKSSAHIVNQLLTALAVCHKENIAHRDLKPENILIQDNKSLFIKLIDFGFAKVYDPKKRFRDFLGSPLYIAPEILNQKPYDTKCDIWSAGIILFILLSGNIPYKATNQKQLFETIRNTTFTPDDLLGLGLNFNSLGGAWRHVSKDAKDFLLKMLEKDPEKRASAVQLLQHKWIKEKAKLPQVSPEHSEEIMNNLKNYKSKCNLAHAVFTYMATNLVITEETEELKKLFLELDTSKTGSLSEAELKAGFDKLKGKIIVSEGEIGDLIQKLDTNRNGEIDYSEFLTATVAHQLVITEQNLETAFSLFDRDGNGFITSSELKVILESGEHNFDTQLTSKLIEGADQNRDDKISFEEFRKMMTTGAKEHAE